MKTMPSDQPVSPAKDSVEIKYEPGVSGQEAQKNKPKPKPGRVRNYHKLIRLSFSNSEKLIV